jgi:hypothetical protein
MSTQRYHFLTIVGRSARELEAACEAILARRPAGAARGNGMWLFNDYTPAVQVRIDGLCQSLIDAADALPVVHHATHVDGWAAGNHGLMSLPWPDGRSRAIGTMGLGVAIYPAPQADAFLKQAAKARRRGARKASGFWAWYPNAVATALEAGRTFKLDYTVAVVTECLGGSREDYEIEASQATLIAGIKPGRGNPALTRQYEHRTRQRNVLRRKLQNCVDPKFRTSSSGRARS